MLHYFKKKPHSWHREYFWLPHAGSSCSNDPQAARQQLTPCQHVPFSLYNLPQHLGTHKHFIKKWKRQTPSLRFNTAVNQRLELFPNSCGQMRGVFFFLHFFFFRATHAAHGGSQARAQMGATAASLCHSNIRSKLHLQTTPQIMAMLDP